LKIDAQKPVERELKGLILVLTHWVSTSGKLPCAWFTHEHRRCNIFYTSIIEFQIENPGSYTASTTP
jgi:hypothetical protein